jgi:hypothetical protein
VTPFYYADSGNGFHARINFGGADCKAPAAANPEHADSFAVNIWTRKVLMRPPMASRLPAPSMGIGVKSAHDAFET